MAVPNTTITHHHVGEVKAEFKAGIRPEDFPHLANILINLYSDPVQAVIREYATNALDAHIAAGNTDPILVTLPSSTNPEFVVQDYGIGLSIDDLENVYSMYGRSLKRESNDFVGQLGLGCKSGLTYADSFTITAIKDGVKCVAMSTKDERGIGTIRVIDTVTTDEPNGVRIAIPVRTFDINEFRRTAESLFQFWDHGTVLVNGEAPEVPEWRKQGLALDNDTWVIPSDAGLYSSYIVMGNVAYEVPDAEFRTKSGGRQMRRFVARVNMGDVDFTPAREAVHNTAHTAECLRELNDFIGVHFTRVLNDRLSECATRWDETLLKVLWKGSQMKVNADQAMPIWEYQPRAYGRKARAHTSYRFAQLTNTSSVVVTGFPNKSLSSVHRERLAEMAPNCRQFVIIPKGADAAAFAGRGNTFTWDEVVGSTNDPSAKGTRAARSKRDETRYSVLNGSSMTAAELAALGTKVLYLFPRESAAGGTLDCTVVSLYSSNQIDRLKRLVPGITHYSEEYRARRDAIMEAITVEDRAYVSARYLHNAYNRLNPSQINDPDLAAAIRRFHQPQSDRLAAAKRFGITVPGSQRDVNDKFNKRYPLLNPNQQYYAHRLPIEDVVMYINSKYTQVAIEALSKDLDFDLPADSLDTPAS